MSSGGGNGQLSLVPPGFRFHPTDEELLYYYLRKKVSYEAVDLDVIREVDLNRLEPWDLRDKCRIGSGIENEWYFFSHKDKKYPTGTRTNRATNAGFWKATGRDKAIYLSNSNSKKIGMRKTLVFYTGRAPHGQKTDWIMHEYRLEDNIDDHYNNNNNVAHQVQEDGWVVCRVFRKKLCHGVGEDNIITSNRAFSQLDHQPKTTQFDGDHENEAQVLLGGGPFVSTNNIIPYMKLQNNAPTPTFATDHRLQNLFMLHEPSTCMHLPQLWSPESTAGPVTSSHHHRIHQNSYNLTRPMLTNTTTANATIATTATNFSYDINRGCGGGVGDWSFLDKLLQASHAQNLRNDDNIITRFNYPNSLSLANVNDVSTSNSTPSVHGSYTLFGASTPNPMF